MSEQVTAERLRELFHYDPETGLFTRKVLCGRHKPGTIAGTPWDGRVRIQVDGKLYLAHRLAWLHQTGFWPLDQLDHMDGDGANNRFSNLRECSNRQNMQNTGRYRTNTSGLIGVSWCKAKKKWQAGITVNYRRIALGMFDTPEEAHQEYLKAKRGLHTFQPVPRETKTTKASNDQTYQTATRG